MTNTHHADFLPGLFHSSTHLSSERRSILPADEGRLLLDHYFDDIRWLGLHETIQQKMRESFLVLSLSDLELNLTDPDGCEYRGTYQGNDQTVSMIISMNRLETLDMYSLACSINYGTTGVTFFSMESLNHQKFSSVVHYVVKTAMMERLNDRVLDHFHS